MSSHGNFGTGAVGPEGYGGAVSQATRTTPLGRLENALNRLDSVAGATIGAASRLTGGWPSDAKQLDKAPMGGGVFGEIETMADAIHRICDRLDEANAAVMQRLP